MEAVKLFDRKDQTVTWDYDGEADTVYLSFGEPRPAVGVDLGEGVIVRYDERAREVVGLTLVGVGRKLEAFLHQGPPGGRAGRRRRSS